MNTIDIFRAIFLVFAAVLFTCASSACIDSGKKENIKISYLISFSVGGCVAILAAALVK
jgi:formate hydrogenlyase subunit 3/multisubunit Na+/H+ antiporter MnhD subunit